MTDLNPQGKQMADASMVRTLEAQARAIWPQEMPLLQRYALAANACILDAGCGTGEGASRLAELFPRATVLGVDIIDSHLELARARHAHLAPRLVFERQSIYELAAATASFDLTVCRHVLHSIPLYLAFVVCFYLKVVRRCGACGRRGWAVGNVFWLSTGQARCGRPYRPHRPQIHSTGV